MKFWHMQLHPNQRDSWSNDDIKQIVKCNLIGCSGDPISEFNKLNINDIVLVRHTERAAIALVKVLSEPRDRTKRDVQKKDVEYIWFDRCCDVEILELYDDSKKIPEEGFSFVKTITSPIKPEALNFIKELYDNTPKIKEMKKIEDIIYPLEQKHQIILQGAPGTGKTRLAEEIAYTKIFGENAILPTEKEKRDEELKKLYASERFALIQFHPAYSYEDFVRGIVAKTQNNAVTYEVQNKILAEMAEKAMNDKEKAFVLIIDEINRANLPAVLGELIYALEYRDKPVKSLYELDGNREIILPKNLYIIGTMNTADRSVGHIDYAIRRRFAFVDVLPEETVITNDKAKGLFNKIKGIFKNNLSSDFQFDDIMIGHSYFLVETDEDLDLKLKYEIKPILREYVKDGILTCDKEEIKNLKIN